MEDPTTSRICNYPNCQMSFRTNYNLRRHVEARHWKLKKFSCDFCGLKLASNQTKREHMYIHTGEKPFPCGYPGCPKMYRQSSQLSVHRKTHQQQDPHQSPSLSHLQLPSISEERQAAQCNLRLPLIQFQASG